MNKKKKCNGSGEIGYYKCGEYITEPCPECKETKEMKIKMTEQNFQILVSYWAGKLNLPLPLYRKDNRSRFCAAINYCDDCKFYNFMYNFKRIKKYTQALIAGIIFHELGHIKYYNKVENIKERVKREYLAERYSLDCIKKYYPDYLKRIIKNTKELLKDKEWVRDFPEYVKAFNKIKEYK